jgi:polysaccharide export outer membrane protein
MVQTIALHEGPGDAQVEIGLERLVDYGVEKEESRLVLTFRGPARAGDPLKAQDQAKSLARDASPSERIRQPDNASQTGERIARLPGDPAPLPIVGGPPNPLEYVIGGMDVLEVNVYQEKDLSGTFRVSADGDIPFPLLGNIRVAGLTPSQAQQRLEALLREGYLKNPQVSVTVHEYRSKGVSVLGAVNKPGAYQLLGGRTSLLELLSMAGGVSLEEGSKSLILVRPDDKGETKSTMIDVDRLLKEGDASLNVNVQPNDAIYVTKADAIIVYGEVKNPGTYPLGSRGMSVLEAISKAGGVTQYAAPNRTRIIRIVEGREKNVQVRVGDIIKGERTRDVTLLPGDVIVVPESYF